MIKHYWVEKIKVTREILRLLWISVKVLSLGWKEETWVGESDGLRGRLD